MAERRCGCCHKSAETVAGPGRSSTCPCTAGVWPATEGTACVDCGVEFRRGERCLKVALTRLTGRRAVVVAQCLGCAAYEQVLGVRYRHVTRSG